MGSIYKNIYSILFRIAVKIIFFGLTIMIFGVSIWSLLPPYILIMLLVVTFYFLLYGLALGYVNKYNFIRYVGIKVLGFIFTVLLILFFSQAWLELIISIEAFSFLPSILYMMWGSTGGGSGGNHGGSSGSKGSLEYKKIKLGNYIAYSQTNQYSKLDGIG